MDSQIIKLREHRKARGHTVHTLAAASGASAATICRIENRKMERVNWPTLTKLATALTMQNVAYLAWPPLASAREEVTA